MVQLKIRRQIVNNISPSSDEYPPSLKKSCSVGAHKDLETKLKNRQKITNIHHRFELNLLLSYFNQPKLMQNETMCMPYVLQTRKYVWLHNLKCT